MSTNWKNISQNLSKIAYIHRLEKHKSQLGRIVYVYQLEGH